MNDPFLVAAFFDHPNLLAVRFRQSAEMSRVAAFSYTRRPDAVAGGLGRIGSTILVGMAVVGIVGVASVILFPSNPRSTSPPMVTSPTAKDFQNSTTWQNGLITLGNDLAPDATLRPWYVRTLVDVPRDLSLRGDATGGWLKPRCSPEDVAAYKQGVQLAHLLTVGDSEDDLAVILDLPGPLAIATAAGMASAFDPVLTMDNLPHPNEVVRSSETLAALVFWRPEFIHSKPMRAALAPPVFVLEGDRMHPYANESNRFDNRSRARLPNVDALETLGVEHILYVRQHRGDVAEADDLNVLFLACAAKGIDVRHLALDSLSQKPAPTIVAGTTPDGAPTTVSSSDTTSQWFWQNYGFGHPFGWIMSSATDPDALYRSRARQSGAFGGGAMGLFDGGLSRRQEIYRSYSGFSSGSSGSSSGGSWGRGFGSSSG